MYYINDFYKVSDNFLLVQSSLKNVRQHFSYISEYNYYIKFSKLLLYLLTHPTVSSFVLKHMFLDCFKFSEKKYILLDINSYIYYFIKKKVNKEETISFFHIQSEMVLIIYFIFIKIIKKIF